MSTTQNRFARTNLFSSRLDKHNRTDSTPARLIRNTLRAVNAETNNNWALAVALWQTILKDAGQQAPEEAYQRLSQAFRKKSDFIEASKIIDQALTIFPESVDIKIEHAEILTGWKKWPEAIKAWSRIIDLANPPEIAFVRLSNALAKIGDIEKADNIISKGLKVYPKSSSLAVVNARNPLDCGYTKESASRWTKVLKEYSQVIGSQQIAIAASTFRKAGRLKESEKLIESSISQANKPPLEYLVEKAQNLTASKDWQKSLSVWNEVVDGHTSGTDIEPQAYHQARFNIAVLDKLTNIAAYRKMVREYHNRSNKPKVAIITSYTKGYDVLLPPLVLNPDYDYIVYTDDDQVDDYGIYKVNDLPVKNVDGARQIRYVKTHPHELAKDYDVAIWMDTNFMITKDLDPMINDFIKSGMPVGSSVHQHRSNIYEEYKACVNFGKGDPELLAKQINDYHAQGYAGKSLAENGVLLFRPNDSRLSVAMNEWWNQICKYSSRDQLSFVYSLDIHHIPWYRHTKPPINIRNNPLFVMVPHFTQLDIIHELSKAMKSKS